MTHRVAEREEEEKIRHGVLMCDVRVMMLPRGDSKGDAHKMAGLVAL